MLNLESKPFEIRCIGARQGTNYDIQAGKPGNKPDPNQFPETPTKLVPFHHRVTILRYHYSNPTIREQGDDHTGLDTASF
ncbi:MAG: hypothetical protein M3O61_01630 [Gemmatimonadota bacterium]|nr:hypothetical protein [Gemmatimonadota bacterium]